MHTESSESPNKEFKRTGCARLLIRALCAMEASVKRGALVALLTIFSMLASACSTTQTMDGIMSSWDGANLSEVVSQWGYPDEEREFQGKKLYLWHHNKSAFVPQTTNTTATVSGSTVHAQSQSSGGYMLHGSCVRILEVDSAETVVSWQWKGNNCPFGELMEYSQWRRRVGR